MRRSNVAGVFHEGTQVDTKFGRGIVIRTEFNKVLVLIYKTKTPVRVLNDPQYIRALGEIPVQPVEEKRAYVPPIPKRKEPSDLERKKQLKALDALRFGLVPHQLLPELTYGFESLERWVQECLPDGQNTPPKIAEVCGQYGTGKSHTMAVIRYIAQKEGYVTARVEVDGRGVTLADPEKLLSTLWGSLEAEGLCSSTPLLDLYCRAIENKHPSPRITSLGIDQLSHNYRMIQIIKTRGFLDLFEHELDSIISSHDEITASELQRQIYQHDQLRINRGVLTVKKMIGRGVGERPYDFIKSLYGHAIVCKLAGYKGLVVTVDEFEVEWLGTYLKRVISLIKAIIQYLNGALKYEWAPCSLFFANVRSDEEERNDLLDILITKSKGKHYSLDEFDLDAIIDIGRRIHKLYSDAYCIKQVYNKLDAQRVYNEIETHSGRVRSFIKHYVAYLDDHYGPPSASCTNN